MGRGEGEEEERTLNSRNFPDLSPSSLSFPSNNPNPPSPPSLPSFSSSSPSSSTTPHKEFTNDTPALSCSFFLSFSLPFSPLLPSISSRGGGRGREGEGGRGWKKGEEVKREIFFSLISFGMRTFLKRKG